MLTRCYRAMRLGLPLSLHIRISFQVQVHCCNWVQLHISSDYPSQFFPVIHR